METTQVPVQPPSPSPARIPAADRIRIVSTSGTCGGRPRIDGHRPTDEDVYIWHEKMGMTPAEIAATYTTITLAEVHAALAYFYENRDAIEEDIREGDRFVQEMRAKLGPCPLQKR